MKVRELLKELKNMPKDAEVFWQDHDHGNYEWNNNVGQVRLVDYDNIDPWDEPDKFFILEGKVVMIRP